MKIKHQNKSLTELLTIALSAIFFLGVYSGNSKRTQARTITGPVASSQWVQSMDEAIVQSESSGKPIMLVFSGSDWCRYYQLLDEEVLKTPEFAAWSSDSVVKVMVDFPQYHSQPTEIATQNENLKRHFASDIKGYPTVLMIDSDGSVIGRTGYVRGGPTPWITKANSILERPVPHLANANGQTH